MRIQKRVVFKIIASEDITNSGQNAQQGPPADLLQWIT